MLGPSLGPMARRSLEEQDEVSAFLVRVSLEAQGDSLDGLANVKLFCKVLDIEAREATPRLSQVQEQHGPHDHDGHGHRHALFGGHTVVNDNVMLSTPPGLLGAGPGPTICARTNLTSSGPSGDPYAYHRSCGNANPNGTWAQETGMLTRNSIVNINSTVESGRTGKNAAGLASPDMLFGRAFDSFVDKAEENELLRMELLSAQVSAFIGT